MIRELKPAQAVALLALMLVVYHVIVYDVFYRHATFIGDDYTLLAAASGVTEPPMLEGNGTPFFTRHRPVSMQAFRWNVQAAGTEPLAYYLVNAALHCILVLLVYFALVQSGTLLFGSVSTTGAALLSIIFAVHADIVHMYAWISNRTESLMLIGYVLAMGMWAMHLRTRSFTAGLGAVASLLFSVGAKETALHLPVLMLLWMLMLQQSSPRSFSRGQWILGGVLVICASLLLWLRISMGQDASMLVDLWKKPLNAVGSLLFLLHPASASTVYAFFYENKALAIVLFGIGIIIIFLIGRKKSFRYSRVSILLGISLFISLFPRMLAGGGGRLNSVQLFICLLMILPLFRGIRWKIATVASVMFMILHLHDSITHMQKTLIAAHDRRSTMEKIMNECSSRRAPVIYMGLCRDADVSILPYELHYHRHHAFGYDTTVLRTGVEYHARMFPVDVVWQERAEGMTAAPGNAFTRLRWDARFHDQRIASIRPETGSDFIFDAREVVLSQEKAGRDTVVIHILPDTTIVYSGVRIGRMGIRS